MNGIIKEIILRMTTKPRATPSSAECVKVMVRVRPMNSSENNRGIYI